MHNYLSVLPSVSVVKCACVSHSVDRCFGLHIAQCIGNTLGLHLWKRLRLPLDQCLTFNFFQCVDNCLSFHSSKRIRFYLNHFFRFRHRLVSSQFFCPPPLLAWQKRFWPELATLRRPVFRVLAFSSVGEATSVYTGEAPIKSKSVSPSLSALISAMLFSSVLAEASSRRVFIGVWAFTSGRQ